MDPNGAIRALVGGRDYASAPFNRAVNGHRPGTGLFQTGDDPDHRALATTRGPQDDSELSLCNVAVKILHGRDRAVPTWIDLAHVPQPDRVRRQPLAR